jgi:hypothetical protein
LESIFKFHCLENVNSKIFEIDFELVSIKIPKFSSNDKYILTVYHGGSNIYSIYDNPTNVIDINYGNLIMEDEHYILKQGEESIKLKYKF